MNRSRLAPLHHNRERENLRPVRVNSGGKKRYRASKVGEKKGESPKINPRIPGSQQNEPKGSLEGGRGIREKRGRKPVLKWEMYYTAGRGETAGGGGLNNRPGGGVGGEVSGERGPKEHELYNPRGIKEGSLNLKAN